MILADENVDQDLIEALRLLGIKVLSIYELQRGASDVSIINFSKNPPRIILTEDNDFGEWVFAHNISDISVIFLCYHFKDKDLIKKILVKILAEEGKKLFVKFTTLSIDKIRIRTLLRSNDDTPRF